MLEVFIMNSGRISLNILVDFTIKMSNTGKIFFWIWKKWLLLDPQNSSVKLDQLERKNTSDNEKKTLLLNYTQTHFISQMTKRHLWKVPLSVVLAKHSSSDLSNISLRFILSLVTIYIQHMKTFINFLYNLIFSTLLHEKIFCLVRN